MTGAQVRRLALALPQGTEQDHHGNPSFRVRGRIFATLPDEAHLHVMVGEHEIRAAAAADPSAYEQVWWGKRLAALRVDLAVAEADAVREPLAEAWRRKAPPALVRAHDDSATN
ncbi:MAG: hypothetical protein DLM59_06470 [Pseudonocardiales bacterium]|nr:MAG: hypothetical protein DLM59_06470 [Pseudonocardiales bacterium]